MAESSIEQKAARLHDLEKQRDERRTLSKNPKYVSPILIAELPEIEKQIAELQQSLTSDLLASLNQTSTKLEQTTSALATATTSHVAITEKLNQSSNRLEIWTNVLVPLTTTLAALASFSLFLQAFPDLGFNGPGAAFGAAIAAAVIAGLLIVLTNRRMDKIKSHIK